MVAELDLTMGLSGVGSVARLSPTCCSAAPAMTRTHPTTPGSSCDR